MKMPVIKITVSWIKNTYLRRLALLLSFPVVAFISLGQAAILALASIVLEPIIRFLEWLIVMCELMPNFKEQWRAK